MMHIVQARNVNTRTLNHCVGTTLVVQDQTANLGTGSADTIHAIIQGAHTVTGNSLRRSSMLRYVFPCLAMLNNAANYLLSQAHSSFSPPPIIGFLQRHPQLFQRKQTPLKNRMLVPEVLT